MATQTVTFTGDVGMALTVDVLDADTGSSFATGVSATETTGEYEFTLTDSAGTYRINVKQSGTQIGVLYVDTENTAATFYAVSERASLSVSGGGLTADEVAHAVHDALPADHAVSGSYGARWLLANSSQREVSVTGSHHVAADIHEIQTDQLTTIQSGLALETTAQDIKTLVQDVPTTTEFNDRTLLAADYFNATTDTVTVGTNNDKTGYSLSVTPPTASQIRSEIDANSTKLIDIKTLVEDVPTNSEFASGLEGLNDLSTSDVTGLLTALKSDLATAHGSGSWTTADVSTLATQVSVNDLPTNAELATALAAADDAVLTAVATRASQASVDTIDDLLDTEVAAIKVVTDQYATMIALDGSVYRFTANALELGPSGSGGSATVVVYPLNASMPVKTKGPNLTFYKDEVGDAVGPISVTTRDGSTINPVDLAGKTLEVRFVDYLGTSILVVEDADITVSGTDHNQVSFPVTTDLTETVTADHEDQWHYWSLRDVTADDDVVLVAGRARVLMA